MCLSGVTPVLKKGELYSDDLAPPRQAPSSAESVQGLLKGSRAWQCGRRALPSLFLHHVVMSGPAQT